MGITHHCDECGAEVGEACEAHPGATISSIVAGGGDGPIRQLMAEARAAGDGAQVAICQRALAGDEEARAECARVVAEARAAEGA